MLLSKWISVEPSPSMEEADDDETEIEMRRQLAHATEWTSHKFTILLFGISLIGCPAVCSLAQSIGRDLALAPSI